MSRDDNVFLFTLIDFLFQVIFFGVFVYVSYVATDTSRLASEEAVARLLAHYGVSDITELTDELTRLSPAELREAAKVIRDAGGIEQLKKTENLISAIGDPEQFRQRLEKLHKYEEGAGKPPCLSEIKDGRRIAKPIARVIATESAITFESDTPELERVLTALGYTFQDVRALTLGEFDRKFQLLNSKEPSCRYSLTFIETTRYVEPRDAVMRHFNMWPPIKKLAGEND